jgi:hypothetical protein
VLSISVKSKFEIFFAVATVNIARDNCQYFLILQDSVNIVEEVKKINCSQPYLLVLEGDENFSFMIMCENNVFYRS